MTDDTNPKVYEISYDYDVGWQIEPQLSRDAWLFVVERDEYDKLRENNAIIHREWIRETEALNDELKAWKEEMWLVTKPIFEFEHPEMQLGESRINFLLKLASDRDKLKAELDVSKRSYYDCNESYNNDVTKLKAENEDFVDEVCAKFKAKDARIQQLESALKHIANHKMPLDGFSAMFIIDEARKALEQDGE